MKKIFGTTLFAALLLSGCITSQSGSGFNPGCPQPVKGGDCEKNGFIITICSNHGHRVKEDLKTNGANDYTLKGSADHEHLLIINGGHYFRLVKGEGIQIISEAENGHTHTVTINCKK